MLPGIWLFGWGAKLQHGGSSAVFHSFELQCGIGRGPVLLWCLWVSALGSSRPDFHFCQQQESTQSAGVWKNRTKFLILTSSLPVFSVVWKWRISFHDQMWFYFSLRCEYHSVLQTLFSPSSWPGGSIRKLMEIQMVQISRFRGVLQMSACSSVVYWQVPLSWVVLIRFILVLELPCNPWAVCLQCLCQISRPVDLNIL